MYVQDAVGVIFVYDMTCSESIDSLKQWYNMVEEHCDTDKLVIALVGNKCDCTDDICVTPSQTKEFAKEVGATISLDVSAKENTNIKRLLDQMAT